MYPARPSPISRPTTSAIPPRSSTATPCSPSPRCSRCAPPSRSPTAGIVRVHTRAFNQEGTLVAEFKRAVLVPRAPEAIAGDEGSRVREARRRDHGRGRRRPARTDSSVRVSLPSSVTSRGPRSARRRCLAATGRARSRPRRRHRLGIAPAGRGRILVPAGQRRGRSRTGSPRSRSSPARPPDVPWPAASTASSGPIGERGSAGSRAGTALDTRGAGYRVGAAAPLPPRPPRRKCGSCPPSTGFASSRGHTSTSIGACGSPPEPGSWPLPGHERGQLLPDRPRCLRQRLRPRARCPDPGGRGRASHGEAHRAFGSSRSASTGSIGPIRPTRRASGATCATREAAALPRAVDWVGLDAYPGTVFPPVPSPVGTGFRDAMLEALGELRDCYMPIAGLGTGCRSTSRRTAGQPAPDAPSASRSWRCARWSRGQRLPRCLPRHRLPLVRPTRPQHLVGELPAALRTAPRRLLAQAGLRGLPAAAAAPRR